MKIFDWNEHHPWGQNSWLPTISATRLELGEDWLAQVGGVDWRSLPQGLMVRT